MTRQIVGRALQWIGFTLMGISVAIFLSAPLHAQEAVTLTSPETKPTNTKYVLGPFYFDESRGLMIIILRGDNGEEKVCTYNSATTPTGAFLILNLQKANLSSAYAGNGTTGSLKQRIYHRLVVMNEAPQVCHDKASIVGSLTGSVP